MPVNNRNTGLAPFMKAAILHLAILAVWYMLEYAQFGELQWGRTGDDAAGMLYFLATYRLLSKCDAYERGRG